jgi:hypothetical protein
LPESTGLVREVLAARRHSLVGLLVEEAEEAMALQRATVVAAVGCSVLAVQAGRSP